MPRSTSECEGCEYFEAHCFFDDELCFVCYRPDTDGSAIVEALADLEACPLGHDKNPGQIKLFETGGPMRESLNEMLTAYRRGDRLAEGDGVPRLADRILLAAFSGFPVRTGDKVDPAAFEDVTAENLIVLAGIAAKDIQRREEPCLLEARQLIAEHGEENFREALQAMRENSWPRNISTKDKP